MRHEPRVENADHHSLARRADLPIPGEHGSLTFHSTVSAAAALTASGAGDIQHDRFVGSNGLDLRQAGEKVRRFLVGVHPHRVRNPEGAILGAARFEQRHHILLAVRRMEVQFIEYELSARRMVGDGLQPLKSGRLRICTQNCLPFHSAPACGLAGRPELR